MKDLKYFEEKGSVLAIDYNFKIIKEKIELTSKEYGFKVILKNSYYKGATGKEIDYTIYIPFEYLKNQVGINDMEEYYRLNYYRKEKSEKGYTAKDIDNFIFSIENIIEKEILEYLVENNLTENLIKVNKKKKKIENDYYSKIIELEDIKFRACKSCIRKEITKQERDKIIEECDEKIDEIKR